MTVALVWVPCSRCGEACVSAPERWTAARCWKCLPAPLVPRVGLVPWRPVVPRMLPGELGPVLPYDGRTVKERESATKLAAERARYRVLVPARSAARDELSSGARCALGAMEALPGAVARATFALAEDTERSELVRSVALVVIVGGIKAVAFWENGRWSSGHIMAPYFRRCPGQDEWMARVRGEAWVPPSCPRCGRLGVKTRQDGQTYKHDKINTREECT